MHANRCHGTHKQRDECSPGHMAHYFVRLKIVVAETKVKKTFKSVLYWEKRIKKKAHPSSWLLPGISSSPMLKRFFSTPAKGSYLTFMLRICRRNKVKKKRKCETMSSTLLLQLFAHNWVPCFKKLCKSTCQHTFAHLRWLGWENGCSHELSLLLILFGSSAVISVWPVSQPVLTKQEIWISTPCEYGEGGTLLVLPYRFSKEWGPTTSV